MLGTDERTWPIPWKERLMEKSKISDTKGSDREAHWTDIQGLGEINSRRSAGMLGNDRWKKVGKTWMSDREWRRWCDMVRGRLLEKVLAGLKLTPGCFSADREYEPSPSLLKSSNPTLAFFTLVAVTLAFFKLVNVVAA